jgi:UDP-N-acetylglucosamine 2-epimerase (non-hydrolysing)
MIKILCVFGTRPEAIKFAPVIRSAARDDRFAVTVCVTSQHREMLEQVLTTFEIRPDIDLDIMRPNQDLFHITTATLNGMAKVLREVQPDWVLVQGDASAAFAAALAAYYQRTRIGHIEAGLRTGDKYAPFPEEVNRRAIAVMADAHFAPTERARQNLIREQIPVNQVWVTGNTSIDALHLTVARIQADHRVRTELDRQFSFLLPSKKLILVTAHRRESFGEPFREMCAALRQLAENRDDVQILYPVHLNPNVRKPVAEIMGQFRSSPEHGNSAKASSLPNLILIEPVDYTSLVYLLTRSSFVLTDSGGIQEEAPSLGKPVLVMRDVTERPEGVEAGVVRLVGTNRSSIVENTITLLDDADTYARMATQTAVYGDGHAAERILEALAGWPV